MKKRLFHIIEAGFVYSLYFFFRALPTDAASATGGWLMERLGPRLGAHRRVLRHLVLALPALADAERQKIALGMWNNLGRTLAEYAHLAAFDSRRVEVIGRPILEAAVAAGRPLILVSGHLANWEVLPVTAAKQGLSVQLIYRHANNPYVDRLLKRCRAPMGTRLARKGTAGALSAHGALRQNGAVGMLIDQKHMRGLPVNFFGHPAMTATAVAELALRYKALIIPISITRTQGAHFRLEIHPARDYAPDTEALQILTELTGLIEGWIRAAPAQWLWLHHRWGNLPTEAPPSS